MATSNEKIRDSLIRRQSSVIRAGGSLGADMRALLAKTDAELKVLIAERTDPLTNTRRRFGKTRTARLRAIQKAIREIQAPSYSSIRARIKKEMIEVGKLEAVFAKDAISASLPVQVNLALPPSKVMNVIATSKPFEGKVLSKWISQLNTTDTNRMMDQIRVGLVQGETTQAITNRIFNRQSGTRNITKNNVEAITRTAINFMANQGRSELYLANKKIIQVEVYVATLDGRTTLQCIGLDGNRYPVGDGPIPPVHMNCRSLRVPAINGKLIGSRPAVATTKKMLEGMSRSERRRTVASLTGQVPATQTYSTFLRKQPVAFQNDVLGRDKATLFRKGGLTVDKFTNPAGKPFTIAQLREQHPEAFIKAGLQIDE